MYGVLAYLVANITFLFVYVLTNFAWEFFKISTNYKMLRDDLLYNPAKNE